jgi:ribosomal protein L29
MDIDLKYKDIKTLSVDEIKERIASLRISLEDVRLSGVQQEGKDNSHSRKIRRSIARLLTVLNVEAAI